MGIMEKLGKVLGMESEAQKLYTELNTEKYRQRSYEVQDLDEGMAVINESMWGWWKPRYLLNHNTKCG